MKKTIAARLRAHLDGDGTMNDAVTGDLYREAHGLPPDEETTLEDVERWAFETANGYRLPFKAGDKVRVVSTCDVAPGKTGEVVGVGVLGDVKVRVEGLSGVLHFRTGELDRLN